MDDPRWKKIQLILTMFPGEELFKAKFEAENQWTSPTPVVVHPALVRELEELLGASLTGFHRLYTLCRREVRRPTCEY